jgi:hypothetical protein
VCRLAGEYRLQLIYKRPFGDILDEEQGSRDFGPLLRKMGVIDEKGESAMDGDQWEAASKPAPLCNVGCALMSFRFVYGICI